MYIRVRRRFTADRAFVLVVNRLIRPAGEHGLAGWLETDFLCDRRGRRFVPNWHQHQRVRVHFQQFEAWHRALDQLVAAKEKIEVALDHHLRDLFSFKPDLVLYDITSTDVVTIRKIESCPPRGYVDGPQTWASVTWLYMG